jgi:gas vesicle protein
MSSEDRGSGLIFLLVGAAIGAGLGVLFAPKAGKETRDQIGDWLKEKRAGGGDMLAKIKEDGLRQKEALSAAFKAGKQAYMEADKSS